MAYEARLNCGGEAGVWSAGGVVLPDSNFVVHGPHEQSSFYLSAYHSRPAELVMSVPTQYIIEDT